MLMDAPLHTGANGEKGQLGELTNLIKYQFKHIHKVTFLSSVARFDSVASRWHVAVCVHRCRGELMCGMGFGDPFYVP